MDIKTTVQQQFFNYISDRLDKDQFQLLLGYNSEVLGDYHDYDQFMAFQRACINQYDEVKLKLIIGYLALKDEKHINWSGNGGEYINHSIIDGYMFDHKGDLYSYC